MPSRSRAQRNYCRENQRFRRANRHQEHSLVRCARPPSFICLTVWPTMLGGANENSSQLLAPPFSPIRNRTAKQQCSARGPDFPPQHAALINGVQGHVLDYDDAQLATLPSRPTGQQTHPTTPVLAAALALAESRQSYGSSAARLRTSSALKSPAAWATLSTQVTISTAFIPPARLAHSAPPRLAPICSNCHALSIRHALGHCRHARLGPARQSRHHGQRTKRRACRRKWRDWPRHSRRDGFTASENIFDDPMGFFSARRAGTKSTPICCDSASLFSLPSPVSRSSSTPAPACSTLLSISSSNLRKRHTIAARTIDRIRVGLDFNAAATTGL